MGRASTLFIGLSPQDVQRLEAWVAEFDRTWNDHLLTTVSAKLRPGHRLRLPALTAFACVDIRRTWQSGRQANLEDYLGRFPELGPAATVSIDLIRAEIEARATAGAPAALAEFARRFPQRATEIASMLPPAAMATPQPSPHQANTPEWQPQAEKRLLDIFGALPAVFGRYRILRKIGEGGMGSVYLAEDTVLLRPVALKIPSNTTSDNPLALQRFYREARAAATLRHPHICPVYDVGEVNGVHYLTMAYIDGKPLSSLRHTGQPFSQRKAAVCIRSLATAIHEAHQLKIIHRDLKPANILIDSHGEPVITDFGLARLCEPGDERITQTGVPLGTPAYMAPEQALGDVDATGPAADIYALGVILYEMLAGRLPFLGPPVTVIAQVITQSAPAPSQFRADLDPRLETICRKAMARATSDRYATAGEMAAALTEWLRCVPIAPVTTTPPPPTLKSATATSLPTLAPSVPAAADLPSLPDSPAEAENPSSDSVPESRDLSKPYRLQEGDWTGRIRRQQSGRRSHRRRSRMPWRILGLVVVVIITGLALGLAGIYLKAALTRSTPIRSSGATSAPASSAPESISPTGVPETK